MKRKNLTRNALFTSILSLLLCVSMLVGTTFAWFTDEAASGINQIVAGNLDVELYNGLDDKADKVESTTKLFGDITLWEPGVVAYENLTVANVGNLALKYQLAVNFENATATPAGKTLADVLQVGFVKGGIKSTTRDAALAEVTTWEPMASFAQEGKLLPANYSGEAVEGASEVSETYGIIIYWQPGANDNDYNMNNGVTNVLSIDLGVKLLATQLEAEKDSFGNDYDGDADLKPWDGTADISWYNETDTEFVITTPEQLAGLAELVNAGNFFEGKTVKLGKNINLGAKDADGNPILFTPIGDGSNSGFLGTFDGQNHTISNLTQDCNAKYVGLFGCVENATIKNLILDNALIENDGRGYAAAVASCAEASTFENITLKNTNVRNYNHNTAGIVGWLYGSENSTFDGINIEASTTIASWWGSYDTRVGGIVGAMNTTATNTVTIKNSNIACRLDVYNDVCANYQWYNYRMAGMLVADVRDNVTVDGRTQANPVRITCENVTVTFGDWANYHYCEDADYGTPSYAGEGEFKFNRVEAGAGYGGINLSQCDHDENEQHNVLIEFDYLFGARDGKGVYGVSTHDGVTVVNNN